MSDSDGTITKVDFYQGNTLIGTATSAPYTMVWNDVGTGNYKLKAKATDDKGGTTTSIARSITVKTNQAPVIELTGPAAGQHYTAPANILLTATSSDSDGAITKVDFYQGSTLIGTATSAPYTFVWNDVGTGSYTLTAKATDDKGATKVSAARTVQVTAAQETRLYYLHTDHLNTPRVVTDGQQRIVWRNGPLDEPFGNGVPENDPDGDGELFELNLRFPGQYFDKETNTHYNTYRDHYFPARGRYGQVDPIGLEGGVNLYAYVGGNPLIYVDPEGLQVMVCRAPAFGGNVPGDHYWVKTNKYEAGMGGDGRGIGTGAIITPHNGRHNEPDASCYEKPKVGEECVDRYIEATLNEEFGHWFPPVNYCKTYVGWIIIQCTGK